LNRADRRRKARAADRPPCRFPITVSAFTAGDPTNDARFDAIEADYAGMLAKPDLSADERAELERGLRQVRFTRLVLAAMEAPEPESMH
jgi:hypothetical protein